MFAEGAYSFAYSHAKLGGGTSHSYVEDDHSLEDDCTAGPEAIAYFGKARLPFQVFGNCRAFYFCRCHEAPAQPNLRAELTGKPLDELRQRLRASGILQGSDWDRHCDTQEALGYVSARPSRIPPCCAHSTRAGIEWSRCHRAVCMARPRKEPTTRAGPWLDTAVWLE